MHERTNAGFTRGKGDEVPAFCVMNEAVMEVYSEDPPRVKRRRWSSCEGQGGGGGVAVLLPRSPFYDRRLNHWRVG